MVRVKRGVIAHKRRKNLLKYAKGFRLGRKSKYRLAKEAVYHALRYATRDRKAKKRSFRQLWQLQINAGAKSKGVRYSDLIFGLKTRKVELNRKMLAILAKEKPETFAKIIELVKQ